jgi:TolA-binding protein
MMIKKYFISLLLLTFSGLLFSQKTQFYLDKDASYKMGLELFDKKQYTAAQKTFTDYMNSVKGNTLLKTDAEYYAAACGIELFHKDGEWRMKEFIERHPESNKVKWGYFYLGKSNFRKKKYEDAIKFLEKVDIYELTKNNLAELYFKRGYSYFITNNNEKAKLDLFEIKDVDNKYAHPANYYYSHISYQEKNYETALQGFNRLLNDETFSAVVPYYITQIYFIQGKYSEVVKNAPALLNDSSKIQKESEINRMIGESYFNLKDFANALTYFKKSETTGGGFNEKGNYEIGYCYYQIKDYKNAALKFEKVTYGDDSLVQNAWYHLADCHVQLGNKIKARSAFSAASNMNYDPKITEDALFSYAKLCYELSFAPYNDAVIAFQKYILAISRIAKKSRSL